MTATRTAVALALTAATALLTAPSAQAGFIDYTALGTFTTPSLKVGGVTVTASSGGSPGTLNVDAPKSTGAGVVMGFGLGVVGGMDESGRPGSGDLIVDTPGGESISFSFDGGPVTGVLIDFTQAGARGTDLPVPYNVEVEAFGTGGALLGRRAVDLPSPLDVSGLFAGSPIERFTLTPFTDANSDFVEFSVGSLTFTPTASSVPEPAGLALFGVGGLGLLGYARRRPAGRTTHKSNPLAARLSVEPLETRENPAGGALDTTFGTGGAAVFPSSTMTTVYESAVQPDGKVVSVGGGSRTGGKRTDPANQAVITRLNADGSPDTTFGTGGTVRLADTTSTVGRAVAVQPDGKILVGAGSTSGGNGRYAVARLNPNGTLDGTFGSGGWWFANPTTGNELITELEVVPAGASFSIYAGGIGMAADGYQGFAVVKLTPAGQPDPAYGSGGYAVRHIGAYTNSTNDLAVTPSGRAVVVDSLYVAAFTPAGQPDLAFNGTGYVQSGRGNGVVGAAYRAVVAQGERVVVAGGWNGSASVPPRGYVARYTPAGALDPTFGTGGEYFTPPELAPAAQFWAIALGPDGSINLAGSVGSTAAVPDYPYGVLLGRLSADGAADPAFGPAGTGLVITRDVLLDFNSLSLSVDAAGNLVVSSRTPVGSTMQACVVRFTGA